METFETPALRRWRRATDVPLLVLAIGSLPLLALELQRNQLPHSDRNFLEAMNVVVLIAFAVDYVVEYTLAGSKRLFVRREWTSLVIVLAQAIAVVPPSLVPFTPVAGLLRVLRVGPLWQLIVLVARAVAIGGAVAAEGRQILLRHAAGFAMAVAGFTWLCSAVVFTLVEDVGVHGRAGLYSFFDSLWWASATMTTVGYGDLAPLTAPGRITAVVTMVVGISSFAVVTAKLAEFLVRNTPPDTEEPAGARPPGQTDAT